MNMELKSPGKLFGDLKVEDLKTDTYRANHRNKLLAESFYLLGEIEKYGTGYSRIRSYLKDSNIVFNFYEDSGFFVVDLLLEVAKTVEKTVEKSSEKSSEKSLIEQIRENPKITISELSKRLSLTTRAIEKQIALWKEKGVLRRIGSDRGGYWEVVTDEGREVSGEG